MGENGGKRNDFDREIMELAAYMLTSARGLVDEPASYGPFRMVDGVSRLCAILLAAGHPGSEFLERLRRKIDERKYLVMTDMDGFVAMMDEVVIDITRSLMEP